jgi:hypothetical protein
VSRPAAHHQLCRQPDAQRSRLKQRLAGYFVMSQALTEHLAANALVRPSLSVIVVLQCAQKIRC